MSVLFISTAFCLLVVLLQSSLILLSTLCYLPQWWLMECSRLFLNSWFFLLVPDYFNSARPFFISFPRLPLIYSISFLPLWPLISIPVTFHVLSWSLSWAHRPVKMKIYFPDFSTLNYFILNEAEASIRLFAKSQSHQQLNENISYSLPFPAYLPLNGIITANIRSLDMSIVFCWKALANKAREMHLKS